MSRPRRYQLLGTTVFALVGLVACGVASGSHPESTGDVASTCPPLVHFEPSSFSRPTQIDNRYQPMPPGTRLVYQGEDSEGRHSVIISVTSLVKQVDGVTARVIYERDLEDGEVTEAELAFFAQDDAGNVWNLGELPEDFEDGAFVEAPDVWLSGERGAQPGVQTPGRLAGLQGGRSYLQGRAPDIEFLDCASVVAGGRRVTVPAGSFTDVVTTHEWSPLESSQAIQTKEFAPGVGVVRVGAINDPEAETLVLVENARDGGAALEQTNQAATALDTHGHSDEVSELYNTSPVVRAG